MVALTKRIEVQFGNCELVFTMFMIFENLFEFLISQVYFPLNQLKLI